MQSNGKSFTSKQKTGLLVLLAFILFSFKKKPKGDVEVGEGDFGAPGTDGELPADTEAGTEGPKKPDLKTPGYVPAKSKIPSMGKNYNDHNLKHGEHITKGVKQKKWGLCISS
ncbi:hypothetical protein [Flagellimonas algicola]|uniref:Uncharacterized protein n=1 Tax=Flagellimonas algicola TaxID=2583815 RepID=A0ABY2WNB2_9FLAO|nr:hypothetical protein [Allomuricauda algicola]TMU56476.1 hypothetical protein FGG15_02755 [Allomuricauda algicola]